MIIHDLYYVCWWSVHVCIDHIWTMCLLMGVLVKRTPEDVLARLRRRGSASSSKFVHPWQQQPIAEEDFEDFEENQWETPGSKETWEESPKTDSQDKPWRLQRWQKPEWSPKEEWPKKSEEWSDRSSGSSWGWNKQNQNWSNKRKSLGSKANLVAQKHCSCNHLFLQLYEILWNLCVFCLETCMTHFETMIKSSIFFVAAKLKILRNQYLQLPRWEGNDSYDRKWQNHKCLGNGCHISFDDWSCKNTSILQSNKSCHSYFIYTWFYLITYLQFLPSPWHTGVEILWLLSYRITYNL